MSDLTASFNDAASGLSGGEAAAGNGTGPQAPSGSSGVTVPANSNANSVNPNGTPVPPPVIKTDQFNISAIATPELAIDGRSQEPQKLDAGSASAKAELEYLKRAEPKPAVRNNLKPPARVRRAADSLAERQRLARMSAVNAYLEFSQSSHEIERQHELEDDLEFRL